MITHSAASTPGAQAPVGLVSMMAMATELVTLAGIIPGAEPTPIPGMNGTVSQILGYGLWVLVLAGVAGAGFGVYKLATVDKSPRGGGSEPFKWMGGAVAAILLAGSLITILNGIAGG